MGRLRQYFNEYIGPKGANVLIGMVFGAISSYLVYTQVSKPDLIIDKKNFSVQVSIKDRESAQLLGTSRFHSELDGPLGDADIMLGIEKTLLRVKNPEDLDALLKYQIRLLKLQTEYTGRQTAIIKDYSENLEKLLNQK